MDSQTIIKKNTGSYKQIMEHIKKCNFNPPLETQVNLKEYVKKILKFGDCFEYWRNNKLIGLIVVYLNDYKTKRGFITYLGVVKNHLRKGIATKLLKETIITAKKMGFTEISLEVEKNNYPALRFYQKNGFKKMALKSSKILMTKFL